MRTRRIGLFQAQGDSLENFKRRRALPAMPADMKFFQRILSVRKMQELVFVTKTAAKHR